MKKMRNLFSMIIFITAPLFAAPSKQGRFILMTMLYNEKNEQRRNEYLTCIARNLKHPSIAHIHVMYDTSNDDPENILLKELYTLPITITPIARRATFGSFFSLAEKHYPNNSIIICNADIYFDDTLKILDTRNLTSLFIALTRWEPQKDGAEKPRGGEWSSITQQWIHKGNRPSGSQDVWIFQLPIPHFAHDEIQLGTLGCDPCIAYQAQKAGLKVINPCLSIRAHHLHLTNIRHYQGNEKQTLPYLLLPWCTL